MSQDVITSAMHAASSAKVLLPVHNYRLYYSAYAVED